MSLKFSFLKTKKINKIIVNFFINLQKEKKS